MCAICGVLNLPVGEEVRKKMLKTMERRGPDGEGIYQKGDCCLLHRRLAIVDLQGGGQPMELNWAGEHYVLVYNGELYNTDELRRDLQKLGHRFRSHSDTEVLLHCYAQWGKSCLDKLNGIFAFAVWEEAAQRLFLARDPMGVKPLFFCRYQNGLLFASEIKTILAYGVPAQLDASGVGQLVMLGPGRLPGSGVFHGIQELEPGWCGIWEKGRWMPERYWHLTDREHRESFAETAEQVRYLVTDAIRRQMVSDVPIGTFLSGGLDSSIISAVCASHQKEPLHTFSVGYQNNALYFSPTKFQPNSDESYIQNMVDFLHANHHQTTLTPENLVDTLEDATAARDLPGMADVDFSLLAFCREIRKTCKVALSGECADEIFGGYPWYRDPEVRAVEGFPWAQNTTDRCRLLMPELQSEGITLVKDAYADTCKNSDILPGTDPLERRMKEMMNLNFRWFMQTLLDRKDRMSMYSGLEVRVPFCDRRIAEYLYGIPWEYKDYQGREKGLLREAVHGILPERIRMRKKSPYPKTWDPEYSRLISSRMDALLAEKNAKLFHMVRRDALQKYLSQESSWPWYGQLMGKPQTMAFFLQLEFWLQTYNVGFLF